MTPEDCSLLESLCSQLAVEKDNKKFSELIQQLITLLERARRKNEERHSSPMRPSI
jgi:hypothetical protein